MEKEIEERFFAIETKLAYMDDFIEKLQEMAVESQREIEALRREAKALSDRIADLSESIDIPSRRPPHY